MQQIWIEKNQAGQRLDKFLLKYFPNANSGLLYKMMRKKNITLNGKKVQGNEILSVGDEVRSFFGEETYSLLTGKNSVSDTTNGFAISKELESKVASYQKAYETLPTIEVLYEDENVLLLNKPSGVLTQKAVESDLSLNEWLIGYLLKKESITIEELQTFKPSVCNRLDRNTSGLVLCGKSLAGSQALSEMIKTRNVRKYYRTICIGQLKSAQQIDGYLQKNHKTNTVSVIKEKRDKDAEAIRTAYQPLQVFKDFTYLEVELITGKTHQIRAHLSAIGHPLIGDTKYGYEKQNQQFQKQFHLRNQLLHAYRLEFPACEGALIGLSKKTIQADLPTEFERILDSLSN